MCTKVQCQRYIGQYVQFHTPWGYHQGYLERMSGNTVHVLSPRRYIPTHLASADLSDDETKRLDLALAGWGGYGGYGGYGYGGWGYGWGRWAVSFLVIFALLGLWW
ncbi:MAG: hypothetical protein K6T83_08350 [Alicyclobacillus sp.]|nr:hypothetical protein [Alicyclobacillus sp.]